jgi:UDP-3-O-[3-hydroxymyristoyl] glucosamine N-acyltransferase
MATVITVAELARQVGAVLEGDGAGRITGIAGIRDAAPGDIAFVANPRYAPDAARTKASAVIVAKNWTRPCSAPALIRANDPDKAFAQIAVLFAPPPVIPVLGIHPTAVMAKDVQIGTDVSVGPYCVLEPGVKVGDRAILFAGCYLGHGVTIGSDTKLYPHVTVREYCQIGNRNIIHNGTVIGSDGFGYTVDEKGVRTKIPQIGIVIIGDDVEIGANVTVDRARFGKTRIGNGVKIDNLVQIAHNVVIGDHAVIVAQVGIAGSAEIGAHVVIAGQAGVAGHIVVGEWAVVGGQAAVTKDVPPKTYVSGYPAMSHEKATRLHAHVMRLPELKTRVAELEKRLQALEQKLK